MTAYAMWNLTCDAEDENGRSLVCPASLDDVTNENASGALRTAKEEGWTRIRRRDRTVDLCPLHSKQPVDKESGA